MTRQTAYHGYDVPEPGDPEWNATILRFFMALDTDAVRVGPIDNRPSSGERGRWYLATDGGDQGQPAIYFDSGSRWRSIVGDVSIPNTIPHRDSSETILRQWAFDQSVDTNITGNAATADEAEVAESAENATHLGGEPESAYARRDRDETITGRRTYEADQTFEAGLRITDRTFDLPQHDGSNPPASDRGRGSIWFRTDDQPS